MAGVKVVLPEQPSVENEAMTRDERIEAVARDAHDDQIRRTFGGPAPMVNTWEQIGESDREQWRAWVRPVVLATLRSLLEPSEGMVKAGDHGWMNRNLRDPNSEPIGDSFRAMIQQAIKEME